MIWEKSLLSATQAVPCSPRRLTLAQVAEQASNSFVMCRKYISTQRSRQFTRNLFARLLLFIELLQAKIKTNTLEEEGNCNLWKMMLKEVCLV